MFPYSETHILPTARLFRNAELHHNNKREKEAQIRQNDTNNRHSVGFFLLGMLFVSFRAEYEQNRIKED